MKTDTYIIAHNYLKRKKCPRCSGKIYVEQDVGTEDIVCVCCGWRNDILPLANYLEELGYHANSH